MNKILITGYKHSGTTMLMSLLRNHPQVGWIEMEESYIEFDKPKKFIVMMASQKVKNLKQQAWGEKIPWGDRKEDKNCVRAIGFTKKWLKFFEKDARVLHILRHPLDVSSSGRADGNFDSDTLKQVLDTVPKYINFINNNSYCATIVYEDLVINPREHLNNIFNFCGLKSNGKILTKVENTQLKFGKINADRAFAFRKEGVHPDIDYDAIINKGYVRL